MIAKAEQTKRPTIRVGDLAYIANAGFGTLPLYRITRLEFDSAGDLSFVHVTDSSDPRRAGEPVPASRVIGAFANILNATE